MVFTSWSTGIAVLVVTFVLTQILVTWLQRKRLQRIERKSLELCGKTSEGAASGSHDASRAPGSVPITLITGFLGSGKTTLVNRLLASPEHSQRLVVIENELGSISIDHALIDEARQANMPQGVVVLKNGCMCCSGETPGSELERVLDQLLSMSAVEGGAMPFDAVLIETTGMADPSPILQILCRREMRGSAFYLDAVVTLVDCKHVLRHLESAGPFGFARSRAEAERQIALADRIILNKRDLVAPAVVDDVRAAVRRVNSTAKLLLAEQSVVPISEILYLHAFSTAHWLQTHTEHPSGGDVELKERVEPSHAASVSCVSMRLEAPLDLARLQAWLQELVQRRSDDLYRMKGVLHIAGRDERFVLHGIHAQVSGSFDRPWGHAETKESALVIIGYRLSEGALRSGFSRCGVNTKKLS